MLLSTSISYEISQNCEISLLILSTIVLWQLNRVQLPTSTGWRDSLNDENRVTDDRVLETKWVWLCTVMLSGMIMMSPWVHNQFVGLATVLVLSISVFLSIVAWSRGNHYIQWAIHNAKLGIWFCRALLRFFVALVGTKIFTREICKHPKRILYIQFVLPTPRLALNLRPAIQPNAPTTR